MTHLPTTTRPLARRAGRALAGLLVGTAVLGVAGPALAKNGLENAPATPTACAPIAVTNSGKVVKNRVNPPDVRFTVTNCGTQALDAVVTVREGAGFFATTCASPLATPVAVSVAPGAKVAASVPAYRGPCGWYSQASPVFVDGYAAWQAHTLVVTVSDGATGTVLGTSTYTWKDDKPGV